MYDRSRFSPMLISLHGPRHAPPFGGRGVGDQHPPWQLYHVQDAVFQQNNVNSYAFIGHEGKLRRLKPTLTIASQYTRLQMKTMGKISRVRSPAHADCSVCHFWQRDILKAARFFSSNWCLVSGTWYYLWKHRHRVMKRKYKAGLVPACPPLTPLSPRYLTSL